MNKKAIKTFIALTVMLIVILQSSTLTVGASPDFQVVKTYWGSIADHSEVGPGDRSVTLNVVVQNIGYQTYSWLDATLYLQFPFSNITGGNVVQGYSSGGIPSGQTATLQFQLDIAAAASIGSYSLVMSLRYGPGLTFGESVFMNVLLLGRVELKVSVDPSSLSPGSTNTLTVDVSNKGTGHASKVSVTLNFPYGLSIRSDNQWSFPSLAPNENKTIILDAYAQPSLAGSSVQIVAYITYIDAYGTSRAVNMAVGLKISPIANVPLVLTVEGSDLLPGMLNTITLNIRNDQTNPVSFVQASLTLPSVPAGGTPPLVVIGDNTRSFPSMDPFQSVTFSAKLMVSSSAAGSNYQLTLTLSYLDPIGITRTENHVFGVQVAGYTSLTVSKVFWGSSAVPIEVQPGDDNQPLTVVIVNSGTVLAQNVTATLIIESPFSYQYTSGGEIIEATNETSSVGTIMPSGSGLAQFTLSIGGDSTPGLFKLKMMLKYLENSPIVHLCMITVDIPVRGYSDMALQKVSVLPSKVYPGDENVDLKVFVTNAGNAAAKNVSVKIVQAQYVRPSWGGADSFFIGTVQPGQIVPADFNIDVDELAPSPSYPTLIAKIVYGPTRNVEKSEEIPLFLSAKSRFVVTSTQIPEIHVSDTGIVILVTFRNIGAEAAQGTRVEIEVSNVFSGTTSDYLGTVEPGDEKTASFILDIDSNAKIGSYVLNQRFSWSQKGATHLFTQDLSLKLNILENPLGKLLPSIIIILLVIVAAVIVIIVARRRFHSKMQPKQT